MVLKEEKIYILKDEELRAKIIWWHYNILVAGHRRKWKAVELVTKSYW